MEGKIPGEDPQNQEDPSHNLKTEKCDKYD